MQHELTQHYNPSLVALSVIIAMIASYTALDIAGRVHASHGRARTWWILGGAAAMGTGMWTMHFVGMLALQLQMPVVYDAVLVTASVGVAIAASAFALWIVSRHRAGQLQLAGAGICMGTAVAGMHYIGMAAMGMNATITYDRTIWWASIGIAVTASYVALNLARMLGASESNRIKLFRGAAAVVMGIAIAGMHYTGMAAAQFAAHPGLSLSGPLVMPPLTLTIAVITAGALVIGLALVASMIDRMLDARAVEADLRAAKEAAEQTSRAKSEFLSNMSHELRTPLNSVIGFANVLLKNKQQNLTPQDVAYLGRIVANGRHLLGLINSILDLSKIEAGKVELELGSVDLGVLVRDTVLEMEGQTQGKKVRLVADVPESLTTLTTDAAKLKQVLINLIGNALKFTAEGSITVRVHRDDASGAPSRIDVVDTGIGIPAHRLEAVFEAFQQADSSTSRQYGGTGLGLTITRSLASLMGFDVRVDSKEGVGSTFSVVVRPWVGEVPVVARPAVPVPAMVAARVAGGPSPAAEVLAAAGADQSRVRPLLTLVIDDDPDARALLGQQLVDLGCEVVTAASADEGIELAKRVRPDLVTLDIMMPRKGGIEALHEFKTDAELRNIPVVLVSVVANDYRGKVFGALECLEKPVTREALDEVMRRGVALQGSPRILVIHEEMAEPQRYADLLLADGVPIDVASGIAAAKAIIAERGAPSAIVIEAGDSESEVFEWISSIRENRSTLGVPIAVVVPEANAEDTGARLRGRATVLARGAALRADLSGVITSLRGRAVPPARELAAGGVR